MAYETGTALTQEDLIDKLTTFAAANGWTLDEFSAVNDRAALSRDDVFVQFRWDNTAGSGSGIALFQSLGFTIGVAPGSQTGDSGNGDTAGVVTTGRRMNGIGNGPFPSYHFFADDAEVPYVHVVLEYAAGLYRSMSFGNLIKNGDWTGGEYACATKWENSFNNKDTRHNVFMDAIEGTPAEAGTVHCEGFPSQAGSSKWGVMANIAEASIGTDRAGNSRIRLGGGSRDGFLTSAFNGIPANPNNGFIPFWPILVFTRRDASVDEWRLIGKVPDLRILNGKFLDVGEEMIVGGDTWKCFPWVNKGTSGETSGNMFFAVKKVA